MAEYQRLNLKGKVAIITGSSAGIGAATAILMAQRGAEVTIHGRREDKLKEVAQEILETSGKKAFLVLGDCENEDVQSKLINGTIDHFGRLDILVNNAGWMQLATFDETDEKDLRAMLENHIVAPFALSKLAAPELIRNKGNIVMTSSIAGMTGIPYAFAYAAAKAGMDNLMRSLAGSLASEGVRVNTVNPGPVKTDLLRDYPDVRAKRAAPGAPPLTPLGRAADPQEVAELIAFIASDAAAMITGQRHAIEGGKTAFAT